MTKTEREQMRENRGSAEILNKMLVIPAHTTEDSIPSFDRVYSRETRLINI